MNNRNKILMERKIRKLLRRTDWIVYNAESIFTEEQVTCVKEYRQALRDINKETDDITQWVFPDTPDCVNSLDLED